MRGIYIPSMELPTSCFYCPMREWHIIHGEKITSCRAAKTLITNEDERLPSCPLVPVPEHGRLIDADKALADNEEYYSQLGRPDGVVGASYRSVLRSINLAPTIIPASGGTDNE